MPMYTYMCRDCKEVTELFQHIDKRQNPVCPKCGKKMGQDYSVIRLGVITGCLGYDTEDITGAPVHVSTLKQERALCEANGVRRASSDEVYVGKREKPKLKEPFGESFERKRQEMGVEL